MSNANVVFVISDPSDPCSLSVDTECGPPNSLKFHDVLSSLISVQSIETAAAREGRRIRDKKLVG